MTKITQSFNLSRKMSPLSTYEPSSATQRPMPSGLCVAKLLWAFLTLAALCANVGAQTNAPGNVRRLSLQDCIQLALTNNLDLQIDRYDYTVPLYALQMAYGDYDPTASFSGQHDHRQSGSSIFGSNVFSGAIIDDDSFSTSLQNGLTPWGMTYNLQGNLRDSKINGAAQTSSGSVAATVTQPLLKNFWIDKTRLTIRQDKNRLKSAEWNLKLQIITIITKLEQAYYDLMYRREDVIVKEKALEAAQRLVTENRKKVEVGALAPLDLKSAESQAAASEADLIDARSQLAVQEATIKGYITGHYRELAPATIEPTAELTAPRQSFSLQDSWILGLTKRPELQQAKLDVENAGIQLKYDKNQLFPELDVFGTYGYNGSGRVFSDALYDIQRNIDRPSWTVGGSIGIPLARVRERANYRSDKALLAETLLKIKRWERDIMVAIDNDIRNAQSSFEQVGARRAAREFAEADLDAEEKKLQSGKSTPYTVLQKLRDLNTARGQEILALSTYNKNLSQLSQDEGTTLERLNVGFEVPGR